MRCRTTRRRTRRPSSTRRLTRAPPSDDGAGALAPAPPGDSQRGSATPGPRLVTEGARYRPMAQATTRPDQTASQPNSASAAPQGEPTHGQNGHAPNGNRPPATAPQTATAEVPERPALAPNIVLSGEM